MIVHLETVMPESRTTTSYYVASRPAPGQPWRTSTGKPPAPTSEDEAREKLDYLRRVQPSWEHVLVRRTVTTTDTVVPEA